MADAGKINGSGKSQVMGALAELLCCSKEIILAPDLYLQRM